MENNPSKLCLNSNQTGLNNQAFDAGSRPLAPLIEVSAGVHQVSDATSPFPDGVQDLLSLNPKKRLQTIFVSTRQDDYFCGLAQNRLLDGQSRLAAAIKIKDNEKRDAALAELAQDQSLEDELRIRAADKMMDIGKKHAVFTQLAADEDLGKLSRLEASLFTESCARPTYVMGAEKSQEALLEIAKNPSLDAHSRIEAAASFVPGKQREKTLQELDQVQNVDTTRRIIDPQALISEKIQGEASSAGFQDQSFPLEHSENVAEIIESETINLKALETLLLTLAQDKNLGIASRISAVCSLAPGGIREDALIAVVTDLENITNLAAGSASLPEEIQYELCLEIIRCRRLRPDCRINTANLALAPGEVREGILLAFAKDQTLDAKYRLKATEGLAPGEVREGILLAFAKDQTLDASYRIEAAQSLVPGQVREDTLLTLAQDATLDASYRIKAAKSLAPGQVREDILLAFAQDKTVDARDHLQATAGLTPGEVREELLLAFTKDQTLYGPYRIEAAKYLAQQELREEILLVLSQDQTIDQTRRRRDSFCFDGSFRVEAASSLAPGQKRECALLALVEDETMDMFERRRACEKLESEETREDAYTKLPKDIVWWIKRGKLRT